MEEKKKYEVEFRGSWLVSVLPLLIFAVGCVLCFIVWETFSMVNLLMFGIVGLIVGSVFAKDMRKYWKAVVEGMSSDMAATLALILLVVGIFTQMMARAGVAEGFVWLGSSIGLTGALFVAFTFFATCVIATATGTSLGTIFSGFPIFYPSGILLGADPVILAGAIVSGAIFGDHLSPVSDTTIISSVTQKYGTKNESADIAGVVSSRFKYAVVAAMGSLTLYLIFGGGVGGGAQVAADEIIAQFSEPRGLIMLIPVAVLLTVAYVKRNIFMSITCGIVVGTITGLLAGVLVPGDILAVRGGSLHGFLFAGVNGKLPIVGFNLGVFGILGVLRASGTLDRILNSLINSSLSKTTAGSEWVNSIGSMITAVACGSANTPALVIYGPIANDYGQTKGIHPYRRANIIDCMVNSLPVVIPFSSAFIFITIGVIQGLMGTYDFITPLSPFGLAIAIFHPYMLFIVFGICIFTGWGRIYETKDGGITKDPAQAWNAVKN